jgi:protein-L-isoaspartate(D-aspartate) O-methyltransferase
VILYCAGKINTNKADHLFDGFGMTEARALESYHKVLEIGTVCGYQSAVLAEIAAQVSTIEILPDLTERAGSTLHKLGYRNIHGKCGDGLTDWAEQAPFDRIIIIAAPLNLPG